jgi:hypothetical protein
MNKGNQFELKIVKYINDNIQKIETVSSYITEESCNKTIDLMNKGVPIIHSAPFYNKIDKTNIYIIVNRFKELREKFSTFDKNNIITGKKNITGQYKPLVHSLDRLDTNLRWIIPTVQNKPKLYSEKINDNQTAFVKSNLDDDLNTYKNAKNDKLINGLDKMRITDMANDYFFLKNLQNKQKKN